MAVVIDLSRRRDRLDAEKYRLCQAAALLKLFEQENGKAASTTEELSEWAAKHPRPIDPFTVLTPEEIEKAVGQRK